jgi:hypothetical protein
VWLAALAICGSALAADASSADADAEAEAAKAVQAERKAARNEIAAQRALVKQRQTAAESECYQRFYVEDCLSDARMQAREQDKPLRERELQLNDQERRERAAQRLKDIEAKQADKASAAMEASQRPPAPVRDIQGLGAQRVQDAQQRAAQQSSHQRDHDEQVQRRAAGEDERRAAARADYDAKQKAAAERRARAAEAARERGPQAAPLPATP